MARPRGEFRDLIAASLAAAGPGTSREIAQRTGIAFGVTMETLNNMVRAGEVEKLSPVRRAGVCRPVPFYGLQQPTHGSAQGLALEQVMGAWLNVGQNMGRTAKPAGNPHVS